MNLYFIHCGTYSEPYEFGTQVVRYPGTQAELVAYLTPILQDVEHPEHPYLAELLGNLDLTNPYIPAPGVPAPNDVGLFAVEPCSLPELPLPLTT